MESYAFDLFAGQVFFSLSRTVGDGEAAFGGAVDQVGGRSQVILQLFVPGRDLQGVGGAEVAVFPDQPVDLLIFSELFECRSQDDQFTAVGQGHAGSVNALIPQPGAFKFAGVEPYHHFLQGFIHHFEVDFQGEAGSLVEYGEVVADEKSVSLELPAAVDAHHGLHINDGQVGGEVVRGIVKDFPDRRVGTSHHPFHTVGGADEMAFVDPFGTPCAHEDILVVVGHSHHFMGDHLSDREDQVKASFSEQFVDLCRPGIVDGTF